MVFCEFGLREGLKMTSIVREIWHDALDEGMAKGMEAAIIADVAGLGLAAVEALRNIM